MFGAYFDALEKAFYLLAGERDIVHDDSLKLWDSREHLSWRMVFLSDCIVNCCGLIVNYNS